MTRSKAAERRQERQAEKRRQRLTTLALIIIGAAVLLIILVILSTRPAEAPIPEGTIERYSGLTQTRTDSGFPRLGDPAARVIVQEYSSFACPACQELHEQIKDALVERVRGGQMQLIFIPLTTGSITNANGAARAAICAVEQGKFWELADALFAWQDVFGNQAFTNNRIVAGLAALDIDQGRHSSCLGSSFPSDVLRAAEESAAGLLNFAGTPTITINGVVPVNEDGQVINDAATIIERIDAALAQAGGSVPAAPELPSGTQAVPTVVATEENTGTPEASTTPQATPTTVPTAATPTATPQPTDEVEPQATPTT